MTLTYMLFHDLLTLAYRMKCKELKSEEYGKGVKLVTFSCKKEEFNYVYVMVTLLPRSFYSTLLYYIASYYSYRWRIAFDEDLDLFAIYLAI